jgi:hypothetical protein
MALESFPFPSTGGAKMLKMSFFVWQLTILLLTVLLTASSGVVAGPVSTANVPIKTAPPVVLALYNWSSNYVGALAREDHAKTAKRLKQVKRAAIQRQAVKAAKGKKTVKVSTTNNPALGLKLLGEELRMVLFQNRLRGLCEVEKAEQVNIDAWRASCADGGVFLIKIYPDGFMTVTRS